MLKFHYIQKYQSKFNSIDQQLSPIFYILTYCYQEYYFITFGSKPLQQIIQSYKGSNQNIIKMNKLVNQQKFNTCVMLLALAGSGTLIYNWKQMQGTKKYTLLVLTLFFYFCIFKYQMKKKQRGGRNYKQIPETQKKEYSCSNEILKKTGQFLAQRRQNKLRSPSYQNNLLQTRSKNQNYIKRQEYRQNYSSQYEMNTLPNKSNFYEEETRIDLNVYMPPNITSIINQIKQKISPNFYLNSYSKLIHNLMTVSTKLPIPGDIRHYQSAKVDNQNRLLLSQNYDVYIYDSNQCMQSLCEFLQNKLQQTINFAQNNFQQLSQLVLKCFGLRIVFTCDSNQSYGNQNDVTIFQLRQSLKKLKTQSIISPKFKTNMPFKQFMTQHLDNLIRVTQIAVRFLQFIDMKQDIAFQVYINILKQQFPSQKVQICRNLSIYSEQFKRIKHGYFVSTARSQFYVTYHRIQGFSTKNPLIAVLAFFTEVFKTRLHKQSSIVKEMNRFFKEKKN